MADRKRGTRFSYTLHLMKSPKLEKYITKYAGKRRRRSRFGVRPRSCRFGFERQTWHRSRRRG